MAGRFRVVLDRAQYFNNDTVAGQLRGEVSAPLHCAVLLVRLRCVLRRADRKGPRPTRRLYRANRLLSTHCTLVPAPVRGALDCDAAYKFDFSFALDGGYPNTMQCESASSASTMRVEWYVAALCRTVGGEQLLLAKTRFLKGAQYAPQPELQPRACMGKAFLVDRVLGRPSARLYVYATLSHNVYTTGEPVPLTVTLHNQSAAVRVQRVTAKAMQVQGYTPLRLSPALDSALVPVTTQHTRVALTLLPRLVCNCGPPRPRHPACAGIVHGGGGGLAPSEGAGEGAGHVVVGYVVHVHVHVVGGSCVRLHLPFVYSTRAAPSQAHLVTPSPVPLPPPSYEAMAKASTPVTGHVAPGDRVTWGVGGGEPGKVGGDDDDEDLGSVQDDEGCMGAAV